MGDAVGDLVKDGVGDLFDGGGHGVLGVNGADDGGPALITAGVLNANALNIGNDYELLPNLLCKTAVVKLLTENCVGLAKSVETVSGDGA